MLYVNYIKQHTKEELPSFEQLFYTTEPQQHRYIITQTYENTEQLPNNPKEYHQKEALSFQRKHRNILQYYSSKNMQDFYNTFQIPKHSGGYRTIQAPDSTIKNIMKQMLNDLQHILYPCNSVFAYTPKRTIKNAIEAHQKKNHKWFLHLDLIDFFGKTNPTFLKEKLLNTPFFNFLEEQTLDNFIHFVTLNEGLPQGTPLSPFLTNLAMIPFDFKMQNKINKNKALYTRYADDILISTPNKKALQKFLNTTKQELLNTPYSINENKTRITSNNGKNWNLGLMLNKDNNITIGYRNKEKFRAKLHNFCILPHSYNTLEAQQMLGLLQYYLDIEPIYFQNLLTKYESKFNIRIKETLIDRIKSG